MLVPLIMLKAELGAVSDSDDALLMMLLESAESALAQMYALPSVPSGEATRTEYVDGSMLALTDCASVSSVTSLSGSPISFTEIAGWNGSANVRGVKLASPITGWVNVTGTFGSDSTPTDIRKAIIETAKTWYRRSTLGDGGNDYIGRLDAVPKVAHDLLGARRRMMM